MAELAAYVKRFSLNVWSLTNFVDYGSFETGTSPVKRVLSLASSNKIDAFAATRVLKASFNEHRVTLKDDLFQVFTKDEDLMFVNLERNSQQEIHSVPADEDALLTFYFDLSDRIVMESRTVNSIPALLA